MLNKPKRGAAESDVTTAGEGGGSDVERRGGLGGSTLKCFPIPSKVWSSGVYRFDLNQAIVTGNK
ncbi:GD17825 [Drosophila simulans]|uniref:GD17825 n=1 Tax=Drosophila simulans TaxID=7240 RepID=B4Q748_DROSI|nr:GD17825 [Drosophila simulans]